MSVTARRYHAAVLEGMTETELQSHLVKLCRDLGLGCYHTGYSLGSAPGYPDLTIVGPGGVLWWELKGPRGRVSDHQRAWIARLEDAGQEAEVVKPQDLPRMVERLIALAGRA